MVDSKQASFVVRHWKAIALSYAAKTGVGIFVVAKYPIVKVMAVTTATASYYAVVGLIEGWFDNHL
jgi:hypothetical protein